VTYQIIASVTENLVYKGPDGKLVPWLAESWTTAKDGRSVTFKLRRDVKFHDGTPFNADAVKFNFDRIVDPKFKAGGARASLAGLRRLEGPRRVLGAGQLRDAVRAVPHLRGVRPRSASSPPRRCARAATRSTRSRSAPASS
jgi:ABC-type transport system substrate-binding protein